MRMHPRPSAIGAHEGEGDASAAAAAAALGDTALSGAKGMEKERVRRSARSMASYVGKRRFAGAVGVRARPRNFYP